MKKDSNSYMIKTNLKDFGSGFKGINAILSIISIMEKHKYRNRKIKSFEKN